MSSPVSIDVREILFVAGAQKDFEGLPDMVRRQAIATLSDLQNNRRPPPDRYKELTGNSKLSGVAEIRINADDGNTYRVYEIVAYREVIYVLDAGAKKSPRGNEISRQDVNMLDKRRQSAETDYNKNQEAYQKSFAMREQRRARLNDPGPTRTRGIR